MDAIEGTGFLWPQTTANFLRWFSISSLNNCQDLAELTLALLARVCRHRTGQHAKVPDPSQDMDEAKYHRMVLTEPRECIKTM